MDDLIQEFITETSESLSTLDLELVKLEQNPGDGEILSHIFRLVHTIKGTCGFLGLPRLEAVAHAGENVLGKIRDKAIPVSSQAISLVLESLDAIKMIMEHLGSHAEEPAGDDAPLIRRLNAFVDSGGTNYTPPGAAVPDAAIDLPDPEMPIEIPSGPPVAAELLAMLAEAGIASEPAKAAPVAVPSIAQEAVEKGLAVAAQNAEKASAPAPAAQAPAAQGAHGGGDSSIRVSLAVLENLMSMVGELVLTRNQLMQIMRGSRDDAIKAPLQHLSHITTELQEGIMKTRMQPIGNAWAKFPRLIRDLSLELGKKIDLKMLGAETELDRQLLEMIKDPLTHMVRNSCDHGLEMPADRLAAAKPETGLVTLSAYHEGGHILVEIRDDGRGMALERIRRKAVENGLATEAELAQMSEKQIMQFIFRAGFSTAEKVTAVSGRGVGMDVVRANIEKIGGTIELDSKVGRGSIFLIKIPLTLAIVSVLIVEADAQKFAIPQINVVELVKTGKASSPKLEMLGRAPVLRLRDRLLPLVSLSSVLGLPETGRAMDEKYIVVCRIGAHDFGIIVDHIHDTEEIVVKPVSSLLSHIPVYSGNTVLGDGSVIMILDPNGIVKEISRDWEAGQAAEAGRDESPSGEPPVHFLLFRTRSGAPKSVPLELVARLEEIAAESIEYSDGQPVVQYRGSLMTLAHTPDQSLPAEGLPAGASVQVIVFTYDNKSVGLIVEEILDIVSAVPSVEKPSKNPLYLGGIVMQGRSTDVIDVGYLLSEAVGTPPAVSARERGARLLFVEDSMFFRNMTVPFLTQAGYEVTAVPSGAEAVALLDRQGFDLVVTDIEMPGMDGFALCKRLREAERTAHLPVIGFSATVNSEIDRKVEESGMRDFVMKTERERLIHAIGECLAAAREHA